MSKPHRSSPTRHRLKCLSALTITMFAFLFCLSSATAASDPSTTTTPPAFYHESAPVTVYDETAGCPAEYLVDEYPVLPQRQIYILTPGHQYRFQLNLSDQQDRPIAQNTAVGASFVSSLPDNRIGLMNVSLSETSADEIRRCYFGRLAFVADCPEGITLSLVQPTVSDIEALDLSDGFSFTLQASAGQIGQTAADEASPDQVQRIQFRSDTLSVRIFGSPKYISYDPELDSDLVAGYLWPDRKHTYG